MKIVMICEFFNEALEFQENLLAEYYTKNGHDVVIVTSTFESVFDYYNDRHDPSAPAKTYWHNGVKVIRLKYRYNILNRLRAYTSIRMILEEERPNLIYLHDIIPNIPECVAYIKQRPDCRMIMDYHADYSNSGKNQLSLKVLHGILRKHFLDQARPYLQKIFPIVPASTTFLREVYGVPDDEMELLPLGTDLEYGAGVRARKEGAGVRDALGIRASDMVVFTGGKLTPNRKTEHLLEAVRAMGRPDLHLIVVGDGDEAYKARLAAVAGGLDTVHFVGWQDKPGMYRHLDAADIAVFPAAQSVIWQQAIGMRLPLVVSERSELTGWHRQEVGYLNRHDNVIILDHEQPLAPQIGSHLERMLLDRAELARRSEGARRTAEEMLDWNRLIHQTLRFNLEPETPDREGRR